MKTYAGETGVEGGGCHSDAVVPSSETGATLEARNGLLRQGGTAAAAAQEKEKRKTSNESNEDPDRRNVVVFLVEEPCVALCG
jgi:hypothetical protein